MLLCQTISYSFLHTRKSGCERRNTISFFSFFLSNCKSLKLVHGTIYLFSSYSSVKVYPPKESHIPFIPCNPIKSLSTYPSLYWPIQANGVQKQPPPEVLTIKWLLQDWEQTFIKAGNSFIQLGNSTSF